MIILVPALLLSVRKPLHAHIEKMATSNYNLPILALLFFTTNIRSENYLYDQIQSKKLRK